MLDCKHKPSKHEDFTTGTAYTSDGREICWDCAYKEEVQAMQKDNRYYGYLSGDKVTSWTGGLLGKVWNRRNTTRWGNKMIYIQFHAIDGSSWWGLGHGEGEYAHLYRYKNTA